LQKILVLNEAKANSYKEVFAQIAQLDATSVVEVKSVPELENHLKSESIFLLVLIVDRTPSDQFIEAVSKSRNIAGFREAHFLSIHKRFYNYGIQKALMAGAKFIYMEPIDHRRIVQAIQTLLQGNLSNLSILPEFTKVTTIACRIEVFGRVGKMLSDNIGDLQIESDAKLTPGHPVRIRSLIAKEQGFDDLSYIVDSAKQDDNYYHYSNSYQLSWQADFKMKMKLAKWVEAHKGNFALPKTKVLWIRDTQLGAWENTLNKTLFSLHLQIPGKVTHSYLRRLNPRILIADRLIENTLNSVLSWLKENKESDLILISTHPQHLPNWRYIPLNHPKAFKLSLLSLTKPLLQRRISNSIRNAKYLDRKSNYSRCALSMNGRLVGIEKCHLKLELENELERNTVFYATFPLSQGKNSIGIYLKMLKTEALHSTAGFVSICEIIPISDQPELFLGGWSKWAETQSQYAEVLIQFSNRAKLYFLESTLTGLFIRFCLDLVKVFIALAGIGFLCWLIYIIFPKAQIHSLVPSSSEDILRGIRDAFK